MMLMLELGPATTQQQKIGRLILSQGINLQGNLFHLFRVIFPAAAITFLLLWSCRRRLRTKWPRLQIWRSSDNHRHLLLLGYDYDLCWVFIANDSGKLLPQVLLVVSARTLGE